MRKRKKGRKFGRQKDQRKALLKALATALILEEKIKTTEARAKELRAFLEHRITYARKGGLSGRRLIARVFALKVAKKLCEEIAPRYKERRGGYTRIIKLGQRLGDGAKMAIIELIK